jgi:hypothetical protein
MDGMFDLELPLQRARNRVIFRSERINKITKYK